MKTKGWNKEAWGSFTLDLGEDFYAELYFENEYEAGVFLIINGDTVSVGDRFTSQKEDPAEREADFRKQALNILLEHFDKPTKLIQSLLTQP